MQFRFIIASPEAHTTAQLAVELDMREARLPWAYRCYYALRKAIPCPVRRTLQHQFAPGIQGDWYLPQDFYQRFASSVAADAVDQPIIHPWPGGARIGLVLTHDVEHQDGMAHVNRIAELEEDLGFRSTWNFVPCGGGIDHGLINDLVARSFEIGVHGYNHDGRLFASKRVFDDRCQKINLAMRALRAKGFRAPMVHRNLAWMQSLDIEYDGSCFDIDPLQPMPGGVGQIWPFMAGRFVELPYTMPQDHTLFVVLREPDGQIWHRKLAWLRQRSGMVMMLTHPDYSHSDKRLGAYRELLISIKEAGDYWHGLAQDVAAWWRSREASSVRQVDGRWVIEGSAAECGVAAWTTVRDGVLEFERVATGVAQDPVPYAKPSSVTDRQE